MAFSTTVHDFRTLIRSSHPIVSLEMVEEERVSAPLPSMTAQERMPLLEWSITRELTRTDEGRTLSKMTATLLAVLQHLHRLRTGCRRAICEQPVVRGGPMRHIVIIVTITIAALTGCTTSIQKPQRTAAESPSPRQNFDTNTGPSRSLIPSQQPPSPSHKQDGAPLLTSLPSRSAIVQSAVRLLGSRTITIQGRHINYDCAGVTRAIFLEHGIDLYRSSHPGVNANGVRLIHSHVRQHGMLHQDMDVHPGDLVFFDNTWDFNGDGLLNDPLTHVGIVEQIEQDGTVTFISRVAGAVARYRMNLSHPHIHKTAEGRLLNDYIRRKRPTDPENTARLTGELFSFYGNLLSPQKSKSFQRQSAQYPSQQQVSEISPAVLAER